MPAIPWKTFADAEPAGDYCVMASRLPLRSHLRVPLFLRLTLTVRTQLAEAAGLLGYSLLAEPLRKTFWTLSAWRSQADLETFARTLPHAEVMRRLRPHMGQTTFVTWSTTGAALPIAWADAKAHLAGTAARQTAAG